MTNKDGNPVLSKLTKFDGEGVMTFGGTAAKSLMLLGLLLCSALYIYGLGPSVPMSWVGGSALGAFIIALITIFKPNLSPYTSPVYAVLEGVVLGYVSLMADLKYPGIAIQAVLSTSGVFAVMLMLYSNRTIRVNHQYMAGISAAMFGILIIYLADIILRLFGITMPVVNDSSPIGIIFSVVVVGVAALSLAIDFNQIEEGVNQNAPKVMEWYSAFGLMISLVWLYMEILRLLQKVRK